MPVWGFRFRCKRALQIHVLGYGKETLGCVFQLYSYINGTTMKVLLDINDARAKFVLELLSQLKGVKAKALTPYKAEVLEGLQEAVEEMKLIKEGKLKGIPAKDLLDEL